MGCYACDAHGRCKSVGMKGVVKWTLMGALVECYGKDFLKAFNRVQDRIGPRVSDWNNAAERTYEDVYNLVKELDI